MAKNVVRAAAALSRPMRSQLEANEVQVQVLTKLDETREETRAVVLVEYSFSRMGIR